jgi:hypothetical protein
MRQGYLDRSASDTKSSLGTFDVGFALFPVSTHETK